jgi:ATP phosphoribosyltransferase regulatory subunit
MPSAVISGGRYDNLCRRLGKKTGGIGFAVTLNYLSQAAQQSVCGCIDAGDYLNIALPKGRLGDAVCSLLIRAGLADDDFFAWERKLILTDETRKMRYFAVKPSDVAVYVENGAADIGIVGSDVLEEYNPDVYEIADTGLGACQMVVAAPVDFVDDGERTLRISTKFPRTARTFFEDRDTRIIHLNGSIELAPLLGLSDVIVDIVETGSTLKQNNLHIVNVIKPISARLIANRAAYQFKQGAIDKVKIGVRRHD